MTATFLLPVYNGAVTLRQALDSILRQRDGEFEVILIDDASTDGSGALARALAARDPRVRVVVHEHNEGLAATLNEGLERATHDLVLRLDQDDEALPGRLERQRTFMAANPHVAVAGSFVLHMGATPASDRLIELPTSPKAIAERLHTENCLYHPAVAMRRDLVLEAGGYRASFKNAEDYDLWLRLSRDHDLANIPEPLIRYRFSVAGMTLGRKWEQLYFVVLAQAANADPGADLALLETVARAQIDATDRRAFLSGVARGTVEELLALRLWTDAVAVTRNFARDIGARETLRLTQRIARTCGGVVRGRR